MPKASKKELQSLYTDHKVQLLISKFSSGEIDALNPVFNPNLGIRYPIIDEVVGNGGNKSRVSAWLNQISRPGHCRAPGHCQSRTIPPGFLANDLMDHNRAGDQN